jgi:hypothetical protein
VNFLEVGAFEVEFFVEALVEVLVDFFVEEALVVEAAGAALLAA